MLWINLAGAALIALIVWWFWIYKSASVAIQDGAIEILVKDGVYQPSKIRLPANQKAMLTFTRVDSSPCSESLQIPDLDINASDCIDTAHRAGTARFSLPNENVCG